MFKLIVIAQLLSCSVWHFACKDIVITFISFFNVRQIIIPAAATEIQMIPVSLWILHQMHRICTRVMFHFVFIAFVIFLCTVFWEQRPPTFPLGAVVHLRLLAVLQVRMRMRQDVVGGGGAQQLLGAAAVQAVLAAVGGSDFFGGAPQTPALPAEGAPGGAGSLTDGAAGNHREVLTETERRKSDERKQFASYCRFGLRYAAQNCLPRPVFLLH